jgi:hypothetical protein
VRRAALEEAIGETDRLFPSRRLGSNGPQGVRRRPPPRLRRDGRQARRGALHRRAVDEWLKVKAKKEEEFVIGGYTPPAGSRTHFGRS